MLNPRRLRRNDVVMEREKDGHWSPYGRVWRRHDDDHVEVIDCTKHVTLYHEDELVLVLGYSGFWTMGSMEYDRLPNGEIDYMTGRRVKQRFVRMATLRRLKRMATRYQPHFGGSSQYTRAERAEALANPDRYVAPSARKARKTRSDARTKKAA